MANESLIINLFVFFFFVCFLIHRAIRLETILGLTNADGAR